MAPSYLATQITAVIKTIDRPEKLVALVKSIRCFYTDLPIVIIDDSLKKLNYLWDTCTRYIHTEYDIGVSEGRNRGVKQVQTPYTLLLDDDFIFTKQTKLETFLQTLNASGFDLVAGDVFDFSKHRRIFHGLFQQKDDYLILKYNRHSKTENGWPRYDFTLNFFLARTAMLLQNLWDPAFKILEHEYFFWCLKQNDIKVTHTRQVAIDHFPTSHIVKENSPYYQKRIMPEAYYHKLFCQKVGVSHIYFGVLGRFKLGRQILAKHNKNWTWRPLWIIYQFLRPPLKKVYILSIKMRSA